jgi:hypothetical protein
MRIFYASLVLAALSASNMGRASAEDGPCQEKDITKKVACLNARLAKLEAALSKVPGADAQYQIFIPFRGQCLQWIDTNRPPNATGCLPKADERSADQFWTLRLK